MLNVSKEVQKEKKQTNQEIIQEIKDKYKLKNINLKKCGYKKFHIKHINENKIS